MKAAKKVVEVKREKWKFPIDISKYNRSPYLTKTEKEEIKLLVAKTSSWRSNSRKIMERLLQPLNDALDVINPSRTSRPSTIRVVLKEMNKRQTAFWDWREEDWVEIVGHPYDVFQKNYGVHSGVQSNLVAVIYLLFQFNLHRANGCKFPPYTLASKVFGKEFIQKGFEKIRKGYTSLGYTKRSCDNDLRATISDLFLSNHSPYLEDVTIDILKDLRENEILPVYIKKELVSISLVLLNMKIISKPLYFESQKGRRFGVEDAKKNVAPEWAKWCQRWHATSTLSPQTRERTYYDAIKTGRWLADKHPEITSPEQWTRQLAIKFVADVDKMKIGDYVENINRVCDKKGKPLTRMLILLSGDR